MILQNILYHFFCLYFILFSFLFFHFLCSFFSVWAHFFSWNDMVFSRLIRFPWSFFFLRNKSINFFLCVYTVVIMYFISSRVFWKFTLSKKPAINKVNIRSIQGLRNSWCTYALFSFTLGFSSLCLYIFEFMHNIWIQWWTRFFPSYNIKTKFRLFI